MRTTLTARQIPLFRASLSFALGISISYFLKIQLTTYSLIPITSLFLLFVTYNQRGKNFMIKSYWTHALLVLFGIMIYNTHGYERAIKRSNKHLLENQAHRATIFDVANSEKFATYFTEIDGIKNTIKVRRPNKLDFQRGDKIKIVGSFSKIESNPSLSGFDYGQYLIDKGIYFQSFPKENQLSLLHSNKTVLGIIRYDVRNWALGIFQNHFSSEQSAILKALILGDRSGLSTETKDDFANSGIIHILAVSGLHVGIVLYILYFATRPIEAISKHFRHILIGTGLIVFAELSGGAPPVLRAVIMSIIYLLGKSLNQKSHPLNLIGTAAAILLAYNPMQLFSVSFQLSFSAVIGIILFAPWFFEIWKPQNQVMSKAWGIIVLGITAQIGTLPFTLYYFHQVPLLSPLLGLLVIPIAGALIGLGFTFLLCDLLNFDFIALYLKKFISFLIEILTTTASISDYTSYFLIKNIWITNYESGLLLGSVVSIACWLYYKRRWFYIAGLSLLFLCITSYQIRMALQRERVQEVTYQNSPLVRHYLIRGNAFELGTPEEKHLYEINEVRSRYGVTDVTNISEDLISELKIMRW